MKDETSSWKELVADRIKAMFLLVAIGDALGMPAEIMTPEEIKQRFGRITDYVDPPSDHKWHKNLKKGMWTDDWQLTMAVAQSMIRKGGIDMDDMAQSHVRAKTESTSGWGGNTTRAVENLAKGIHWSQSGIPDAAGNGISMKVAPVGAFIATNVCRMLDEFGLGFLPDEDARKFEQFKTDIRSFIVDLSLMTHRSRMAVASGIAHAYAVFSAMLGELDFASNFLGIIEKGCLEGEKAPCEDDIEDKLSDCINELFIMRDYEQLDFYQLVAKYGGEGKARFYVLNSLPLSYALFLRNPDSIETLFDTIAAGGDTDTNASMVGALLGAKNGMKILEGYGHLIDGLWRKDEVIQTAEDFCAKFIR